MNDTCSICQRSEEYKNNAIVSCGNCDVKVHQGCYGVTKFPIAGHWFCRKCESQKCDMCPLKSGAFKRSNSSRCGWSHVLCALTVPEVTFEDNISMDLVCVDAVPAERYNKTCVFCERNQRNAMATYGFSIPCAWKNCRSHVHATCAAQAGLLQLPKLTTCSAELTMAVIIKGGQKPDSEFQCLVFCSMAHMDRYSCTVQKRMPTEKSKKFRVLSVGDQTPPPPPPPSSPPSPLPPSAPRPSHLLASKGPVAAINRPQQLSPDVVVTVSERGDIGYSADTPSTGAAAGSTPECVSPADSEASHLRPLPVSTDTEPLGSGDEEEEEESNGADGFTTASSTKAAEDAVSSPEPTKVPVNPPPTPKTSPADGASPPRDQSTLKWEEEEVEKGKGGEEESPRQPQPELPRRAPRRSAAVIANQEFTATASPGASSVAATKATKTTRVVKVGRRKPLKGLLPRGRPSTRHRNAVFAAKKNASIVARACRVRSRKPPQRVGAAPTKPSPATPVAKRARNGDSAAAAVPTSAAPFSAHLLASTCVSAPTNGHTAQPLVPPRLPLSLRGLSLTGQNGFVRQGELNSLEDLLEWQWDQGGALLMQQATGTDVVSLLNCLHQLKMENDSLEEKLLRLQAKREHLRSVNTRLVTSLSSLESPAQPGPHTLTTHAAEDAYNGNGVFVPLRTLHSRSSEPPAPQPPLIIPNLPIVSLVATSAGGGSGSIDPPILSMANAEGSSPVLTNGRSSVGAASVAQLNPLIVESSLAQTERFASQGNGRTSVDPAASNKVPKNPSVISPAHVHQHPPSKQTPLVLLLTSERRGQNPKQQPLPKSCDPVGRYSSGGGGQMTVPGTRVSALIHPPPSVVYPRIQPRQQQRKSDTASRPIPSTTLPNPASALTTVYSNISASGCRQVVPRAIQPALPHVSKTMEAPEAARPAAASTAAPSLLVESSLPSMSSFFGGVPPATHKKGGESLCNGTVEPSKNVASSTAILTSYLD